MEFFSGIKSLIILTVFFRGMFLGVVFNGFFLRVSPPKSHKYMKNISLIILTVFFRGMFLGVVFNWFF